MLLLSNFEKYECILWVYLPCRKRLYNPEDPRNAGELLNYLDELSSGDKDYEALKDCNHLDLSKDEGDYNIHQIGKGVLRQPLEVFAVS